MGLEVDATGVSYYRPGSFYINLRAWILDGDGMPTEAGMPTLMHEYAHLIQDRACLYGVFEFLLFLDSLHGALSVMPVGEVGTPAQVQLPISQHPAWAQSWLASVQALRAAIAPRPEWVDGVMWAYESHHLAQQRVWMQAEWHDVPMAMASFVDNTTNETYEHEIGPREIKEAYSVAVQILHGGAEVNDARQFEYLAVERILIKELGAVTPQQLIAICHWALQSPNPGVRFFEIVTLALAQDALPAANALYDLLRDDAATNLHHEKRVRELLIQVSEVIAAQAAAGYKDLLFQVMLWFYGAASHALGLSVSGRRFPLDTFLCKGDADFRRLTSDIPIPVVEVPTGHAFSFGAATVDSDSVLFIRSVAHLVHKVSYAGAADWPCDLLSSCVLDYKDAACATRPWLKGARRPACAYGAASAYLGLPHLRVL
jgi:hypothetical protein